VKGGEKQRSLEIDVCGGSEAKTKALSYEGLAEMLMCTVVAMLENRQRC